MGAIDSAQAGALVQNLASLADEVQEQVVNNVDRTPGSACVWDGCSRPKRGPNSHFLDDVVEADAEHADVAEKLHVDTQAAGAAEKERVMRSFATSTATRAVRKRPRHRRTFPTPLPCPKKTK